MTHPNRRKFTGVLAILDEPSDKSPSGGRGHRVKVTSKAAANALESLIGMGVNYDVNLTKHDFRRKCGVITAASIVENRIEIAGHLYERDFPEVVQYLNAEADDGCEMGLSYEASNVLVRDILAPVWVVDRLTFTGAAILKRNKAAYKLTSIRIDK